MNHVAVVTPSKNACSETFIRAHIEHLPAEVHVLSGGHLPTYGDGEALLKDHGLLQRIRFRLQQQRKGLSWDGHAKHLAAIERFLCQHQVQAVLAEYGPTGVAMMTVCEKAGIPLVVHFHGYDAHTLSVLQENTRTYPVLFEKAAAIVAVSHGMIEQLTDLGAPRNKLYYNPCGVDISMFSAVDAVKESPDFLAVGRFVEKKSPLLTLLAFKRVIEVVPNAHLLMLGDGALLGASKQLTQAMKFTHAVDFGGAQPHHEIAVAMQRARAFVQHSVRSSDGDSEGTPVAILEAGASGLPVISTRHAGIADVVIDGKTGLLVDELDIDGMSEAMIRLAQDAELAAKMGQAGRKRIEEHFSMEKSIGNLWKIIESTIDESRVSYVTCQRYRPHLQPQGPGSRSHR